MRRTFWTLTARRSSAAVAAPIARHAAATVLFNSLLGMRSVPPQFAAACADGAAMVGRVCGESMLSAKVNAEVGAEAAPLASSVSAGADAVPTRVLIVTDAAPCALGQSIRDAYVEMLADGGATAIAADAAPPAEASSSSSSSPSSSSSLVSYAVHTFNPQTFQSDVARFFGIDDAKSNGGAAAVEGGGAAAPSALAAGGAANRVVVLVENGAFQNELQQYRLRLELFRHGIRVAEHCHLTTMSTHGSGQGTAALPKGEGSAEDGRQQQLSAAAEVEIENYFRACALSPFVAEQEGRLLRTRLSATSVPLSEAKALLLARGGGGEEGVPTFVDNPSLSLGGASASVAAADPPVVLYDVVITSGEGDAHSLVFEGGLDRCLLNTGLYAEASADAAAEAALGGEETAALAKPEASPTHSKAVDESPEAALKREKKQKRRDKAAAAAGKATADPAPSATGTQQRSVGGTFPIGEVITESVDLGAVSGSAAVFAFPTVERRMCIVPFGAGAAGDGESGASAEADPLLEVTVQKGRITALTDPTPGKVLDAQREQLQAVFDLIASAEGHVLVRELGIGINPFLSRRRPLADVTSFERQRGIHVSLGMRHPLFPKRGRTDVALVPCKADGSALPLPSSEGMAEAGGSSSFVTPVRAAQIGQVLRRKDGMFHIDMFIAANRVVLRPKPAFRGVLKEEVLMDFTSPAEEAQ